MTEELQSAATLEEAGIDLTALEQLQLQSILERERSGQAHPVKVLDFAGSCQPPPPFENASLCSSYRRNNQLFWVLPLFFVGYSWSSV